MSEPLCCPRCNHKIPDFEVQNTSECAACGAKLCITGHGGLAALDVLMQLTIGTLFIALIALDHWIGWAFAAAVFAGWCYIELFAQREVLKIEIADESLGKSGGVAGSESKDERHQ